MNNKKTIFIKQQFDALASSKTWDVTINNIDFIPTSVIVRQVMYSYHQGLENRVFLVTTNLIKDPYLCVASDNGNMSPNSIFYIGDNISGSYRFQVQLIDGSVPTNELEGSLVIVLEFSK